MNKLAIIAATFAVCMSSFAGSTGTAKGNLYDEDFVVTNVDYTSELASKREVQDLRVFEPVFSSWESLTGKDVSYLTFSEKESSAGKVWLYDDSPCYEKDGYTIAQNPNATNLYDSSGVLDFRRNVERYRPSEINFIATVENTKEEIAKEMSVKADEFTPWVTDYARRDDYKIVFSNYNGQVGWWVFMNGTIESYPAKGDENSLTLHWSKSEWSEGVDMNAERKRVLRTGEAATTNDIAAITNADNTAIGQGSRVSKNFIGQVALGREAHTSQNRAVAIGRSAMASNSNSIAIGYNAKSHGANTFNVAPEIGRWWAGEDPFALLLGFRYVEVFDNAEDEGPHYEPDYNDPALYQSDANGDLLASMLSDSRVRPSSKATVEALVKDIAGTEPLRSIVTTWEGFLDGSNVVFSITNYISGTYNLDAAKLRILELRDGAYREVYNSRDEILLHLADFEMNKLMKTESNIVNWATVNITNRAPLAWGRATSTGEEAPSNTVFITEPSTVFAGGMEYKRIAVGRGTVCVLVDKGAPVWTQGDEGTFKFQDDGGTNYFGFAKTDSYTIGANTDGIRVSDGVVELNYNITMRGYPCVWYKRYMNSSLIWEQLNTPDGEPIAGASHVVSWEETPEAGKQTCYIHASEDGGFFCATVEVSGSAKFMTNMPADFEAGILCTDGVHKVKVDWNNGSPRFVEAQ